MRSIFLIFLLCFCVSLQSQDLNASVNPIQLAESKSPSLFNKKKNILLISEVTAYTVALVGLNQLWYAGYPRSSFHFINDNCEWLQIDKMGHMAASYYTGVVGIKAYDWAGFERKQAIWYGGMTGSIFLTIIEILDGTSKEWGASSGDLLANTTGSLLSIVQALHWEEQRIQLKYSYSHTEWAVLNPEQLGETNLERALKDYNGHTYWITFNMNSIFNIENKNIPNWLSFALGYGGESMTQPYPVDSRKRYRQYYLSLDIDLNKIKTKSKHLNSFLHTFGFLKFPMPTLELSNGSLSFHPIFY